MPFEKKYDYSSFDEVKSIVENEGINSTYLSLSLKSLCTHFPKIAEVLEINQTNKGFITAKICMFVKI